MNHRIGRVVFALSIGLLVAWFSYSWVTNSDGRVERAAEEGAVRAAREHLQAVVEFASLDIVDPLAPNRKAGKVYVYPEDGVWAVSGYYRRGEADRWHPYLMSLGPDLELRALKIQDSERQLVERAAQDPLLEVVP